MHVDDTKIVCVGIVVAGLVFLASSQFDAILHIQVPAEEPLETTAVLPSAPKSKPENLNIGIRNGLAGIAVLIVGIHLEGNLGDIMETLPLIQQLSYWGVRVDAVSDDWKPEAYRIHSSRAESMLKLITNVTTNSNWEKAMTIQGLRYRAIISAPGPCFVNICGKRASARKADKVFALGLSAEYLSVVLKDASCFRYIWMRERESIAVFEKRFPKLQSPFFGADLSYSFDAKSQAVNLWRERYIVKLRTYGLKNVPTIVVSRENNWGASKNVRLSPTDQGLLQVRPLYPPGERDGHGDEWINISLKQVIFVTSDEDTDRKHLEALKNLPAVPVVIPFQSVQEMLGFFQAVSELGSSVYVDRYHCGIAAHRMGANVTIIRYGREGLKMAGLVDLISHDPLALRQRNVQAFKKLYDALASP
eukprot:m.741974 g.741974  ORF g.741974 m.741974 type:complete len:419 (+) comp23116_c4_seq17:220-1476(+)